MATTTGSLRRLERNRYYYGKLMDVRQWTMEQTYGIEARRLLTRLGMGRGVLCGLGVVFDQGCLWIEPGVAIDTLGREIVIPDRICLEHPEQPTDCRGRPEGDPVSDGSVTISACYHECLAEVTGSGGCGCDGGERCEAGVVQEGFCIRIDRGAPSDRDPFPCDPIFPGAPSTDFDRRRAAFDALGGPCPPPVDECVVLATVTFSAGAPPLVDPFTHRRVIYSNETLFELILCLADRLDDCCGERPTVSHPPRVMRMWPRDGSLVARAAQVERDSFLKQPRVELVFERPIAPAVAQQPDPWLRAWSFVPSVDGPLARRIALSVVDPPTEPPAIGAGTAGESLGVYRFDGRYKKELRTARVLVQLRPDDGGPVVLDTGTPALLLDGEHHGTALTKAQLDMLWKTVTDTTTGTVVATSIWDRLVGATAPPFPSGDGAEGGSLDLGFGFDDPEVAHQPRLVAVWPPNATYLRPSALTADEKQWSARFKERPHLELTFEDTIDPNAIGANLDDWLGLWLLVAENQVLVVKRLPISFVGPTPATLPVDPATTTIDVSIDMDLTHLPPTDRHHLVVTVRGDKAGADSDFDGVTGIAAGPLADALDGAAWPAGLAVTGPPSVGVPMSDGLPGGTAVTFFDYAIDA